MANESVIAPEIILRTPGDKGIFLTQPWGEGDERPTVLARHGLWVKLTDESVREITYSKYASHADALQWLLYSAKRTDDEVEEIRYWTPGELLRAAIADTAASSKMYLQDKQMAAALGVNP